MWLAFIQFFLYLSFNRCKNYIALNRFIFYSILIMSYPQIVPLTLLSGKSVIGWQKFLIHELWTGQQKQVKKCHLRILVCKQLTVVLQ